MATMSISVRLRRTVYQSVHVDVPVTEELMVEKDGKPTVDPHRLQELAIELGAGHDLVWSNDDAVIEVHPTQTPPAA